MRFSTLAEREVAKNERGSSSETGKFIEKSYLFASVKPMACGPDFQRRPPCESSMASRIK